MHPQLVMHTNQRANTVPLAKPAAGLDTIGQLPQGGLVRCIRGLLCGQLEFRGPGFGAQRKTAGRAWARDTAMEMVSMGLVRGCAWAPVRR